MYPNFAFGVEPKICESGRYLLDDGVLSAGPFDILLHESSWRDILRRAAKNVSKVSVLLSCPKEWKMEGTVKAMVVSALGGRAWLRRAREEDGGLLCTALFGEGRGI